MHHRKRQAGVDTASFNQHRAGAALTEGENLQDRKSTRLNSSHANISYAVFCLKKKIKNTNRSYPTVRYDSRSYLLSMTIVKCPQMQGQIQPSPEFTRSPQPSPAHAPCIAMQPV